MSKQDVQLWQLMILRAVSPPHCNICTARCCFCPLFTPILLRRVSPPVGLCRKRAQTLFCPVSTAYEDACDAFSQQGYEQLQRLHWGETRQKIHSSLWWPLDVVRWLDIGLGDVWGEEVSSEDTDFSLKTSWQGNKARAVIPQLHNDCTHVIHRDWSQSRLL